MSHRRTIPGGWQVPWDGFICIKVQLTVHLLGLQKLKMLLGGGVVKGGRAGGSKRGQAQSHVCGVLGFFVF